MIEKITTYLKDKYDPQALILHGSRASGHATENSDWDLFILDEREFSSESARKFGEELDIDFRQLPIPTDDIGSKFGCQLKHAELLLDTNGVGTDLLKRAEEFYGRGFNISEQECEDFRRKLRRTYHRVKERPDHIAHLYRLNFVAQSVRRWYQILQDEWQDNFYIAFPRIKGEDPEFYEHTITVLESDNRQERLRSACCIHERLFNEDLTELG